MGGEHVAQLSVGVEKQRGQLGTLSLRRLRNDWYDFCACAVAGLKEFELRASKRELGLRLFQRG